MWWQNALKSCLSIKIRTLPPISPVCYAPCFQPLSLLSSASLPTSGRPTDQQTDNQFLCCENAGKCSSLLTARSLAARSSLVPLGWPCNPSSNRWFLDSVFTFPRFLFYFEFLQNKGKSCCGSLPAASLFFLGIVKVLFHPIGVSLCVVRKKAAAGRPQTPDPRWTR